MENGFKIADDSSEAPAPVSGDVATAIADVTGDMPAPNEAAIQAEKLKGAEAETDKSGAVFDPAIHETGADGKGIINSKGMWKRPRGRKVGQPAASRLAEPRKGTGATAPADGSTSPEAAIAGAQIAEAIFALGVVIGGEEFQPIYNPENGINERAAMSSAFARLCEEKGIRDIPPGIAVTIAVVGYIAPRFFMPKTKTRMESFKGWLAEKYLAWKTR